MFLGFVGAAILASPTLGGGASPELWAIFACLLATLCYAVVLNYTRSFRALDPTTLATGALTGAAIVAVPAAFLFEGAPVMVRPESWAALLGIGLVSTSFSFLMMYRLLPRVGATNFSIATLIAPVSAIVLGIVLLHEIILPIQLLGILVIFVGLLVMDGRLVRRLRGTSAA